LSQPPVFEITVVFASDEANQVSGRATVRTAALDTLFASIKSFTDAVRTNFALIQRDDGELLDGIVKVHTLAADVLSLIASGAFTVRGAWETSTAYETGDLITQDGFLYLVLTDHTSGTFATDLAAELMVQFFATGSASNTSFSPTSTISAANVQAALEELDSDTRVATNSYLRCTYGGL
jgi:hypothetical protein